MSARQDAAANGAGGDDGARLGPAIEAQAADRRARERIRTDLDTTLIVEAAAGTGKTTALVSRIVAALLTGRARMSRIAAVTFTEKAAGELKLRLRGEIERARRDPARDPSERTRLVEAIAELEEARIGTIHSFCADLLRERAIEAGVDPLFEVANQEIANGLFDAAFERWFERALEAPGEGLRRALRRRERFDREGPRPAIRAAAWELVQWRDFDAPWRYQGFDRDPEIDALAEEIRALAAIAHTADADDWLRKGIEEIAAPVDEATRLETVRGRDYDALEATLLGLLRGRDNHWKWTGGRNPRFGETYRADAIARRAALRERLGKFRDAAGANLAPLLRDELWPVVDYYAEGKWRAGMLDFLDLLIEARNLMRDNAAVRAELQGAISHIFVDEFQDTDPLQAEILILLAADDPAESDWRRARPAAGKLFIVGDPKQSIYRFRRADVALYQDVKRHLLGCGAELEHLAVSFRSTPNIQAMVNAAFAPLMAAESPSQPAYVELLPAREDWPGQPSVVALPVPEPYSEFGRITNWRIDESTPHAIAAFIRWMVEESGWTVTERDGAERRTPVRPRHICLLFRRLTSYGRDVTRPYVRALEARHIAHVLVGGGSFNEREEVEAIRNALGAIERPDDELAVFATLHGPLFAVGDAALLEFRETVGSIHPFRRIPPDRSAAIAEVGRALGLLCELHRGRNRRPIAETIGRMLGAVRAHAGIAIWPTGEQALANVMRLTDMARRYESRSGAVSFRGFVDELEARAERDDTGDAPIVEEGAEGVRIMTVHRAKGLEFPVVILADITARERRDEPSRWVDPKLRLCAQSLAGHAPRELLDHAEEELRREDEEAIRVLYVAATRARDLLVAPVVGDEPQPGWIGKLNPVLYPADDERQRPIERTGPGCPAFGDDSVLTRPESVHIRRPPVAPGAHRPFIGAHRIVWWDPSKLALSEQEKMGIRQDKLLRADENGVVSAMGARDYEAWSAARAGVLEAGAKPSVSVAIATELAVRMADSGERPGWAEALEAITVEHARAAEAERPHGALFGTLVHAILARVDLDANRAAIANLAAHFGAILGADEAEIAAGTDAVSRALEAPVMQAAARASTVRRECPVAVRLDDGQTVEGVVDLAFMAIEAGGPRWTVVDFKTDIDLAARLEAYRWQIALYMHAIGTATGYRTRGVLLAI